MQPGLVVVFLRTVIKGMWPSFWVTDSSLCIESTHTFEVHLWHFSCDLRTASVLLPSYNGILWVSPTRSPCSIASLNRRLMSRWSEHMSLSWLCSSAFVLFSHPWFICCYCSLHHSHFSCLISVLCVISDEVFFTPSAVITQFLVSRTKNVNLSHYNI